MAKRGAAKAAETPPGEGRASEVDAAGGWAAEPVARDKAAKPKKPKANGRRLPDPAGKVETLTITDIGDHLAATFDIPKSHAKIYLGEAVALIGRGLGKGAKVRIAGLGVFQVEKRAMRKSRDPKPSEDAKGKAGKRVAFAASRDLKAKL